ncbi:hypothetical protein HHK36_017548 [Tetracentron sinense]|uniref:Alpha-ketoglutarate-dependent dioxygenase AlkB-like domain-containing protein n=1 Tax=Tetracentron sinense TaxID=13715 RepID=A0A834Z8G9_TETSI|nr:hypothetical protein HHK36_017548 [Tetracentron sinense]
MLGLAPSAFYLGRKRKTEWILGKEPRPTVSDPKVEQWDMDNCIILGWMFNSMEDRIYNIFMYHDTVHGLWSALTKMHTYQFLMGLKSEFEALRAQILNTSPMPFLYEAFATVDGDERRRHLLPPTPSTELSPLHCRKPGHVIDRCFDLHPELKQCYSQNRDQRNKDRGKWVPRTGVIAEVAPAPSISDYSRLQSQIAQLQSHLGLGPASSATISSASPTATLATSIPTALHVKSSNPTWILNSGANNHMTSTPSLSGPVGETPPKDSPLLPRPAPILEPPPMSSPSLTSRSLPSVITTDPFPYAPRCPRSNIPHRPRSHVPPPDSSLDSGLNYSLSYAVPPWLTRITQRICDRTGLFPSAINHVLINEYLPDQGIMPHQDGPAYFPVVAILSLGSPAVMNFTPHSRLSVCANEELDSDRRTVEINADKWLDNHHPFSVLLMPCSLLIFKDKAYSDYLHGIEDSKEHQLDEAVNIFEALKHKRDHPPLGSEEAEAINTEQLKSIQRTTTRVSLTCRLVLKVHKNLFKF